MKISGDFKYINHNPFWHIAEFFVYDIIMRPVAFLYCKTKFRIRFVGADKLKPYKSEGFFIYGNHTQIPGDAYIPNMLSFPVKPYFIVHPDNVSTKGTKNIMLMLGAIPLPDDIDGYKNFMKALKYRCEHNNGIVVFPEAHIWPYYTKIRPFASTSFKYPLKYNKPVFCFTTTYQKRKHGNRPRITVFVDGPFDVDNTSSLKVNEKLLCDKVTAAMTERSKYSSYEFIKYIKTEKIER